MEYGLGSKIRIVEPGEYFGRTGVIVEPPPDPDDEPDPDGVPMDIDELMGTDIWVKLDATQEILWLHEPWGIWEPIFEVI